jgi:hypothetical protein
MNDAIYVYKSIGKSLIMGSKTGEVAWFSNYIYSLGLNKYQLFAGIIAIAILVTIELIQSKTSIMSWMRKRHFTIWWFVIIIAVVSIMLFGIYGNMEAQQFIYFQF